MVALTCFFTAGFRHCPAADDIDAMERGLRTGYGLAIWNFANVSVPRAGQSATQVAWHIGCSSMQFNAYNRDR